MKRTFLVILAVSGLAGQSNPDGPQFTANGELLMPKNYREWVFLSSGLGMTDGPTGQSGQANPKFDNVFVNPSAYRVFQESGRWPDKTILVLEVRRSVEK